MATFSSDSFRASDFADTIMQAVEQIKDSVEKRISSRVARGEVRSAILTLLAEQPMHGYQIIREIEERSGGSWKPSAGSVYPTLQILTDEGLVSVAESKGRKTYSLTKEGEAEATHVSDVPWQKPHSLLSSEHTALPKAGFDLAQAAAQVGRSGTPAQVEEAVAVLDEARRKLYTILAQG